MTSDSPRLFLRFVLYSSVPTLTRKEFPCGNSYSFHVLASLTCFHHPSNLRGHEDIDHFFFRCDITLHCLSLHNARYLMPHNSYFCFFLFNHRYHGIHFTHSVCSREISHPVIFTSGRICFRVRGREREIQL